MTIFRADQDPFYVPTPADYPADAEWKTQPGAVRDHLPLLDPPQADWVRDPSRFKLALKGRQAGFSFCEMLSQVDECASRPNTMWVNLSRGERQSRELLEKAARHVQANDKALALLERGAPIIVESDFRGSAETVKQLEIRFRNGSVIRGLPANADTARGFSGNVFLDEFAFHADARAIKAGVIPIVSRGYKLRIVSTPNGKSGAFYEMWSSRGDTIQHGVPNGYSRHRVDIDEMAARNVHYRPDVAQLRAAMADDELFAQEYECAFLDEATAFIPFELIAAAEHADATIDGLLPVIPAQAGIQDSGGGRRPRSPSWIPGQARNDEHIYFGGADIGRRHDQTVAWIVEKVGDAFVTRQVNAWRNMPFDDQFAALAPLVDRCERFAIDQSGLGMMLAENLARRFGARVLPVAFTAATKEDLAVRFKRALEDASFRIPAASFVRSAFHSIKRLPGGGEHFRFDADRSAATGHADAFWAAALCRFATEQAESDQSSAPVAAYESIGRRRGAAALFEADNASTMTTSSARRAALYGKRPDKFGAA